MPSILGRTAVLGASRVLNLLITIVTPLLLVRILNVHQFGQYREFLLYSMLLVGIVGFGANRSLTYFIPKYPDREKVFLTQSIGVVAFFTVVALLILTIARDLFTDLTSYDFVIPLALFCIFYANFDFVEMYYVAKRRSDMVLYYGVARLLLRVCVVVTTAYFSRDVVTVVYAVVCAEIIRFIVVLATSLKIGLLDFSGIDQDSLVEQGRYVWPMGLSGVMIQLAERATSIFVSISLGPAALALYSIGAYQRSIIGVLRGALADVIFPDMVERGLSKTGKQLPLWRRSTTAYCLLMFPIAAVLIINASIVVEVLFTTEFLDAAPVFQIFSVFLVLSCFEFDLPVRALGVTKYYLRVSWAGLVLTVMLLFLGYWAFGFLGPVLAAVIAQLAKIVYLGRKCVIVTNIRLGDLLDWDQIGRIIFVCILGLPIFPMMNYLISDSRVAALLASIVYFLFYFWVARLVGIAEMIALSHRVLTYVKDR